MRKSKVKEFKKWAEGRFEKVWNELNNGTGRYEDAHKEVARVFFYRGMDAILTDSIKRNQDILHNLKG